MPYKSLIYKAFFLFEIKIAIFAAETEIYAIYGTKSDTLFIRSTRVGGYERTKKPLEKVFGFFRPCVFGQRWLHGSWKLGDGFGGRKSVWLQIDMGFIDVEFDCFTLAKFLRSFGHRSRTGFGTSLTRNLSEMGKYQPLCFGGNSDCRL